MHIIIQKQNMRWMMKKKWKKNFYCIEIIDITKYYSENLPFKQYIFASGNHTSAYLTLMFNF